MINKQSCNLSFQQVSITQDDKSDFLYKKLDEVDIVMKTQQVYKLTINIFWLAALCCAGWFCPIICFHMHGAIKNLAQDSHSRMVMKWNN